jgi:hypothetical protein
VSVVDLGSWDPLTVPEVAAIFRHAPFRWWLSGGHALELHLGRSWRSHEDIDVGICRSDVPLVRGVLDGWDLHVAAAGQLQPWQGQPLLAELQQNNLWCRRSPSAAWALDLTVGDGTVAEWIYRRQPTVRLPWNEAVLQTDDGIPYLAPELQLLFKSKDARAKDHADAREVISRLEAERRNRLAQLLEPAHPWHQLLARTI